VVDLIEKKPYGVCSGIFSPVVVYAVTGILAYLDEACVIPRGDVNSFIASLGDTFSNHDHFSMPKQVFACTCYFVLYKCYIARESFYDCPLRRQSDV
jgi:hypothetical protein